MGMYTGIRFKGYVKEKFRKDFVDIAIDGNWEESSIPKLKEFGELNGRASFIPCGSLAYMPDEWETEPYDKYGDGIPTNGFERTYDEEAGYWTFQCSLKNYEHEIESFFDLIPYFIEKIEHLEYFYEEWNWSSQYDLVKGRVERITDKFVCYSGNENDDVWS